MCKLLYYLVQILKTKVVSDFPNDFPQVKRHRHNFILFPIYHIPLVHNLLFITVEFQQKLGKFSLSICVCMCTNYVALILYF